MAQLNLLQLPVVVLENILKRLDILDLCSLMITCKDLWNIIKNDNIIWKTIFKDKLILHNSAGNSQSLNISWYNRCRISRNWHNGMYKNKILIHHYTNFMPWMKYHLSEVLLLTVGAELHCFPTDKRGLPNCRDALWILDVPKVHRPDVRTNDISRFIIKDDLLICGNRDGCAAVYKVKNINKKPKLLGHIEDCHESGQVEVTAVEMIQNHSKSYILTGSNDSSQLHLWHWTDEGKDINNQFYTKDVINIDNVGVKCLAVDNLNNKVAIGLNGNSKPILLDVNTGIFLMTADETRNIKQAVRDIQWHNESLIVYVTHSGILQMIDTRTHEMVYNTMDPFQSTLYCVKTDNKNAIVVGSSEYSRCVLFDCRNRGHHIQMYFTQGNHSPVYSLDFDSTKLFAAVDRCVSVLNFNINTTMIRKRDYSHVFEYL